MKVNGKEVITITTGEYGKEHSVTIHLEGGAEKFFAGTAAACLHWLDTQTPAIWQEVFQGELRTFELVADPAYYIERWAYQAWAAYHGDQPIGEPGIYGSKKEAQEAVIAERNNR
jgi:hypothetical protein